MRTIAITALVATATSACISNPARNIASNGDPARVVIFSGTGTRYVQQEAGSSVTTHSDGSESSTVNYRNVAQRFKWKTWRFYQGSDELDEQDWWGLKDPAANAEIKSARARAWREQAIGVPLMVVGIAGAAYGQYGVDWSEQKALGYAAYIGGSLIATAGILLFLKGQRTMRDKTLLPLSRAFDTADEVSHCKDERCRVVKHSLGMR